MQGKFPLYPPIRFGTDGWRGIIADDFTFDRLAAVAPIAAHILRATFGESGSNTIIVGYDRRFMSDAFAKRTAEVVAAIGFDVLLADDFAPTPAFSWAAYDRKALGALVITASHNPANYSGLKIKGAFGGSVSPDITAKVEEILERGDFVYETPQKGKIETFDAWASYCQALRGKVNIEAIKEAIAQGKLTVFADVMHGAAAGGLAKILELPDIPSNLMEINSDSDPLFGGNAPEPLPRYIAELFRQVKTYHHVHPEKTLVGFVFDGDADRIAAIDSEGNFLSSQILIPILLEHLAKNRGFKGELIKTISGSDLMPKVAALFDLPVYETPVGYKYIAERMLSGIPCLLGGEESGGVGYGNHIPERDALLSALYVLEAIAQSGKDLSVLYGDLQKQTNFFSHYDRIDKKLSGMAAREKLVATLQQFSLTEIAGRKVIDAQAPDGFKFRLADGSWLLVRFSGTEPLLRLYCEAETPELVHKTLNWIANWAEQFN
ncbi:phosphoglucomutase/phosphomannomutase family protein [Pseudanabaena sp. FACHB-1998]|uniref:phosphoglucomutase/phosphomannomutase family protein n=1 Tax=Pseudanabaena sp. FACHB-1998 TaxID=2692858 RepID=UPI001680D5CD|nr:phosphoglucomutase/phosphomannomutase family protein [Pseudanabaena sp. FACHB-1998]MBD2178537.1 phosphoglucomutase/phosphomannomutase family protein [Pseudanabaena sp. FACHB-1998]